MRLITLLLVSASLLMSSVAMADVDTQPGEYVVFYHHDVLGSPVTATNEQGQVIWHERHSPYGKSEGRVGQNGNAFGDNALPAGNARQGYTGHALDNSAGLTYMKARYYDHHIGRFLSNDPVGFRTDNPMMFNRYSYANGSPYKFIDPDGKTSGIPGDDDDNDGISDSMDRDHPNNMVTDLRPRQLQLEFDSSQRPKGAAPISLPNRSNSTNKRQTAQKRAQEIHAEQHQIAQNRRTTAVTETVEGVRIVSSSEPRLTPAQRSALRNNEIEGTGQGHAEVTGINAAKNLGLTPTGTAASRAICTDCAKFLSDESVIPLSPLDK